MEIMDQEHDETDHEYTISQVESKTKNDEARKKADSIYTAQVTGRQKERLRGWREREAHFLFLF